MPATSWSVVRSRSQDFEDGFDLDRAVRGKCCHADGAPRGLASVIAEDLDHQLAEAIDDLRLLREVGRAVDHAENLYESDDTIEGAELVADGAEYAQPDLSRGIATLFERKLLADAT